MDFVGIFAAVAKVVQVAELAIRAGQDAAPYVGQLGRLFKGEQLTAAESAALVSDRRRLSAALNEPLPPEPA